MAFSLISNEDEHVDLVDPTMLDFTVEKTNYHNVKGWTR
jgi:hypothetical protein